MRAALAAGAAARGLFPRFVLSPPAADPSGDLEGRLAPNGYAAAIVGPLLSLEWEKFVRKFPATRFVLVDAPMPAGEPPRNALFLTFDRTAAFRDAGRAAGAFVRSFTGGATAPREGARIAVLSSSNSGLSAAEEDAFSRGAAEVLDTDRLVSRSLPDPVDRTAIRAAVDKLRSGGTEVFLLGLGEHDPLALEALRDSGGIAVVADWQVSAAYPAQVMLSVENDVPGGIMLAMKVLRAGISHVQGPVRLVRGKKI
jgi:hypothetical protein